MREDYERAFNLIMQIERFVELKVMDLDPHQEFRQETTAALLKQRDVVITLVTKEIMGHM